jgi:hypothetical protein
MPVSTTPDETERGEYGPPADVYRKIARGFNRPDFPFVVVTLSTVNGAIVPSTWPLSGAQEAWAWFPRYLPSGIFYAAMFNNEWISRGPARLVREYLHGGKWLGPIPW